MFECVSKLNLLENFLGFNDLRLCVVKLLRNTFNWLIIQFVITYLFLDFDSYISITLFLLNGNVRIPLRTSRIW